MDESMTVMVNVEAIDFEEGSELEAIPSIVGDDLPMIFPVPQVTVNLGGCVVDRSPYDIFVSVIDDAIENTFFQIASPGLDACAIAHRLKTGLQVDATDALNYSYYLMKEFQDRK